MKSITGNIIDVFNRKVFAGKVTFNVNGIVSIEAINDKISGYILPGFIDSHVHIESSMLVPSRFSEAVVPRGTVGVVSDPHEIANVLGGNGVEFMIEDAESVPLKFFFGAPSCVPATPFENAGAVIGGDEIGRMLKRDDIWFLSEMMNFPGVVNDDKEVHEKIKHAQLNHKPIDGHAPGLKGDDLRKYASAGISTDHECSNLAEAEEKLACGIKIQIREGSAARNFDALKSLFNKHADRLMLCTDDCHPDDLISKGHMDRLIKRGLKAGIDLFDLLRAVTINPVMHYKLPVGLLRPNDPADFIIVKDLENFEVLESYINGKRAYSNVNGNEFTTNPVSLINKFRTSLIDKDQLKVKVPKEFSFVRVIEVVDGELITRHYNWKPDTTSGDFLNSDVDNDIIKLVVVNRYSDAPPSVGFVKNMGLKSGAIGSTVAHDSHNIIVTGCNDEAIADAINLLIEHKGGIVAVDEGNELVLPLPVGGLMSVDGATNVAKQYERCNQAAKQMGSQLKAPFMTLSFLSLLVIPSLKLGDKGLFDVDKFEFTSLFGMEVSS